MQEALLWLECVVLRQTCRDEYKWMRLINDFIGIHGMNFTIFARHTLRSQIKEGISASPICFVFGLPGIICFRLISR